jgi:hypothetical protein
MRFMVMHKVDAAMEAGEKSDTIIHEMGRYIGDNIKSGVFEDGAGLHRSAMRVRVSFDGGNATVTRGPYAGQNELVAGFAMIVAKSMDHAVELATQLAVVSGDREIEIGPVVEGWDLFGGTRPANAPYRFLLLRKADAAYEAGAKQPPAVKKFLDVWKREGVLQTSAELEPSSKGARLTSKRNWVDGPFAEAKELVAGFSIINLPSLADAKAWAEKYGAILGDNEVDVREVADHQR